VHLDRNGMTGNSIFFISFFFKYFQIKLNSKLNNQTNHEDACNKRILHKLNFPLNGKIRT